MIFVGLKRVKKKDDKKTAEATLRVQKLILVFDDGGVVEIFYTSCGPLPPEKPICAHH